MGMNLGPSGGSDERDVLVDINTTPLIDVMLVLLIMLIITIPIQTHATKLNMPIDAPPTQTTQPEVVRIDVEADGSVLLNGEAMPDQAALEKEFAAIAAQAQQPEVHLRADKLVRYASVVKVMAAAQRLGVKKIGLVGAEQFM
ncbi:MAG: biopolymer transporter ExbD [Betaproteobacteria bacterium]|nr:biopolymer transporter ExbD [Betaproteobacteria bacterium]